MKRREFIAGLGGVAAWPLAAPAQQPSMPVVGFLNWGEESFSRTREGAAGFIAFRQGLGEHGYVEGLNVAILFRWAEFRYDQLTAMAADLVGRRVAVIVTTGGIAPALAAKAATTTIPIAFQLGADPVEFGLVSSLNRPGGNITGATFLTQALIAKRLELLHQAVPTATSIGYLVNPKSVQTAVMLREAETAARILGIRLVILNATIPSEIEAAFAIIVAQRVDALCVDTDPFFTAHGIEISALAARHAVPAIFGFHAIVEAGGLMSYGSDVSDAYRLAGSYAGRILKGEKPADLPVQQSTKVELAINLKTANALGLTFPITLLGRADRVIE
jgi:putative tryptophan/tyrosine transport system substrate-binding protein